MTVTVTLHITHYREDQKIRIFGDQNSLLTEYFSIFAEFFFHLALSDLICWQIADEQPRLEKGRVIAIRYAAMTVRGEVSYF